MGTGRTPEARSAGQLRQRPSVADVGANYDDEAFNGDYPDPTGESVVHGKVEPEAIDARAQLEVLAALAALHKATLGVEAALEQIKAAQAKLPPEPDADFTP